MGTGRVTYSETRHMRAYTIRNVPHVTKRLPVPTTNPHAVGRALLRTPLESPMAFDVPGSRWTPDGVPLGWEASWENPHKMVVEEEERLVRVHVPFVFPPRVDTSRGRYQVPSC